MGEIRKYTSENLMRYMGLQVGDRVKWNNKTYTIIKLHNSYFLDANQSCWISIAQLIDEDVEILPRPKRVGDLKCIDTKCKTCPLKIQCANSIIEDHYEFDTLYEVLTNMRNEWIEYEIDDQEIYDLLKTRLDKEVE